eukprot:2251032-Amphidinium_carterae.1
MATNDNHCQRHEKQTPHPTTQARNLSLTTSSMFYASGVVVAPNVSWQIEHNITFIWVVRILCSPAQLRSCIAKFSLHSPHFLRAWTGQRLVLEEMLTSTTECFELLCVLHSHMGLSTMHGPCLWMQPAIPSHRLSYESHLAHYLLNFCHRDIKEEQDVAWIRQAFSARWLVWVDLCLLFRDPVQQDGDVSLVCLSRKCTGSEVHGMYKLSCTDSSLHGISQRAP